MRVCRRFELCLMFKAKRNSNIGVKYKAIFVVERVFCSFRIPSHFKYATCHLARALFLTRNPAIMKLCDTLAMYWELECTSVVVQVCVDLYTSTLKGDHSQRDDKENDDTIYC